MRLNSIKIKNFRTLVDVEIEDLLDINVFLGRNNVGKSSIFSALRFAVGDFVSDGRWRNYATNKDQSLAIEVSITFSLNKNEKREIIIGGGISNLNLVDTPLFNSIKADIKIIYEDGKYCRIIDWFTVDNENKWIQFVKNNKLRSDYYSVEYLDLGTAVNTYGPTLNGHPNLESGPSFNKQDFAPTRSGIDTIMVRDQISIMILNMLQNHIKSMYYFDPIRSSIKNQIVMQNEILASDGSNLVQVLNTIKNNNDRKFKRIEKFVNEAIPNIGILQTPLESSTTSIGFMSEDESFVIPIADMGSGVEQILMTGVVLETTTSEVSIALDEPESHLHPGAQRFLYNALLNSGRQIFISTHSNVFANIENDRTAIYQINNENKISSIRRISKELHYGELLKDVGLRNSDLLFSDAVVFVEGPSDVEMINVLSNKLNYDFRSKNIRILTTNGSDGIKSRGKARSEILAEISGSAPIPHIFIIDRDQKSILEIQGIERVLGDHVKILNRRELENYLLIPRIIKQVIASRFSPTQNEFLKISSASNAEIETKIDKHSDSLYHEVLVKMIRSEFSGYLGHLIVREDQEYIIKESKTGNLNKALDEKIREKLERIPDIERVIDDVKNTLDSSWSDASYRRQFAPGADILSLIFREYGAKFEKTRDGVALLKEINEDEIDSEIKDILERIYNLV